MKVLLVATVSTTINTFLIPHIKKIREQGHKVDIACNITDNLDSELVELIDNVYDIPFQRTIFNKGNYDAYKKVNKIFKSNNYDYFITNTAIASAITRLAGIKYKKNLKSIYICHGFNFCKGSSLSSWIKFYPIEAILGKFTNHIITINQEDFERAKKFNKSVFKVHGVGVDTSKYKNPNADIVKNLKDEFKSDSEDKLIISVGELSVRKNHIAIIKAISEIKNDKLRYIICGTGPLQEKLQNYIDSKDLQNKITLLGFRKDISELLKISDMFAFPSLSEGLGMAGIEAMAAGVPLLTSDRHGIKEYAIHDITAYTADPSDIESIKIGINKILFNSQYTQMLSANGIKKSEEFSLSNSINEFSAVFEKIFNKDF
ncbi:glycosyltransferase [Aerococcus sp. NPDC058936]|uniref:glycosyltransferase n=1 Tax=Aerococcus sp. NPDC058936 TaxID=3346674 RepID=UPI003672D9C5